MNRLILYLLFIHTLCASAEVITSPNMSLPIPEVGVTSGPAYATDINSCMSIIDTHNHTAGQGVQVPSAGININGDLTFQGSNATNLRAVRFTPETISCGGAQLGELFENGVDLYYCSGIGDTVRITQAGTVGPPFIKTAPIITVFLSGSGTYSVPMGALYIRVRMVGGGGGGSGSGTANASSGGGNGGTTSFGTSLLSCTGGIGPNFATAGQSGGGTASLGSGPAGIAITGGSGQGYMVTELSTVIGVGGSGGSSALGGGGGGGANGTAGLAGSPNTGGGGGGGGGNSNSGVFSLGIGGGAGGYIDALITVLAPTYSFAVGAGGGGGGAGTSGFAGGNGGSGQIEITVYFQ